MRNFLESDPHAKDFDLSWRKQYSRIKQEFLSGRNPKTKICKLQIHFVTCCKELKNSNLLVNLYKT